MATELMFAPRDEGEEPRHVDSIWPIWNVLDLTPGGRGIGDDIEIAPKKGYVSLRRRKQFAMIQPSAAGRIDLGLILRDVPPDARLESAKGFNALFTHRVRLTSIPGEVAESVPPHLSASLTRANVLTSMSLPE